MGDGSSREGEAVRLAITAFLAAGAACALTRAYMSRAIVVSGASSSPSSSAKRRKRGKSKPGTPRGSELDLAAMSTAATGAGAGGGPATYETRRAVDEYLQFHFGKPSDVMPYKDGPLGALRFPARCADMCAKHCRSTRGSRAIGDAHPPQGLALDVGCAVGGASFELARHFGAVVGLDASRAFVSAARLMRDRGRLSYRALSEGSVTVTREAVVNERIDRDRVVFREADACDLPASLLGPVGGHGRHDAVLAANLLCRLPDPAAFLRACARLVKPGGILVLTSPYSWIEAWTPREKWLGGFEARESNEEGEKRDDAESAGAAKKTKGDNKGTTSVAKRSFEGVAEVLTSEAGGFDLVEQSDAPFLIKEHDRKYQWGCAHASVWRRRRENPGTDRATPEDE